jgi:hypothetical protein
MSKSLFQRTIRNTVREVNNQKPPPPVQLTYEILLKQVTGMIHNTSDSFESYPVLYLPDDYDMESDPIILQSGQHRVEALTTKNIEVRFNLNIYAIMVWNPN